MNERTIHACKASEVAPGQQKIVRINNMPVGIFEIGDGEYHAMLNICPHRGGQLCEGPQCGTAVDGGDFGIEYGRRNELVRCAWHGWEFDIRTGEALADPKMKAKTFEVSVDGDDLYVHM